MPAQKKTTKTAKTKKAPAKRSPTKKRATATKTKSVIFTFFAPEAKTVHIAGSFNKWSANKDKMTKKKDGSWSKRIALKPGRHEFKFVIDGTHWEWHQHDGELCSDGCGGMNCVVSV